jgi:3-methylcrotonyl-CoA carboxylase alpha subunit
MDFPVSLDENETSVAIVGRRPGLAVRIDDARFQVAEIAAPSAEFDIMVDGTAYRGWRWRAGEEVHVRLRGRTFVVGLPQLRSKAHLHGALDDEIRADMPGTMIALHAEAGQEVRAGDRLATMESMKLQVTLAAPRAGIVDAFHVQPEGSFERGALLVSLKPEADPAAAAPPEAGS